MSGATLLAVALGGAFGATARYVVSSGLQGLLGPAFPLETLALLQDGAWGRALAYVLGSLALGLVGVAAGMVLAGGFRRA